MDFKQYSSKGGKSEDASQDDLKKKYDETVRRTQGKSESELMEEIMREAAKERQAGRLSDDDLKRFYDSISPMLDASQQNKLREILNLLK